MNTFAIAVVLAASVFPLAAEVTTRIITPFTLNVNPGNCPAATSTIIGGGKGLTLIRTTVNPDGKVHIGMTFTAIGKGTDEAGVEWTVVDADSYLTFNGYLAGGQMEVTATENFQLISRGKDKNITLHEVMKVRVAADGTTTVEFERAQGNGPESCKLGLLF
jgi:hypothetical protein